MVGFEIAWCLVHIKRRVLLVTNAMWYVLSSFFRPSMSRTIFHFADSRSYQRPPWPARKCHGATHDSSKV